VWYEAVTKMYVSGTPLRVINLTASRTGMTEENARVHAGHADESYLFTHVSEILQYELKAPKDRIDGCV
jgi:hypothetical protein